MNIWGKIIGTVTGYALDGAAGALIGAVAGQFVDMYTAWAETHVTAGPRTQNDAERRNSGSRYTFTLCIVTLGAKLAKIDGPVSKVEIAAFKEAFRIPQEEVKNIATMFDRARATSQGFESFAYKLAEQLRNNHNTMDEIVTCLFHVALSDGPLNQAEADFIRQVAKIFGFSDSYFQRRMDDELYQHGGFQGQRTSNGNSQQRPPPRPADRASNPYTLLGVAEASTDQEIKIKYRKLVRENHPDNMVASGKSKAEIDKATAKLARINAAYDQIVKERQI